MSLLQNILTALGGLVLGGSGLVAIAYTIFKIFSEKWLNAKFEERLAAYRHAQQRELEQLKFEINTMMDRNVKLHQREFDVLPETWSLLTEAFYTIEPIAIGFYQYPDLDKMSAERLEEFLENSPLTGSQKAELRASPDKVRYYGAVKPLHDLKKAIDSYNTFHTTLSKNAIFIIEPIKTKFAGVDQMLKEAIIERQVQPQNFDVGVKLTTTGRALLEALERDVKGRLWSSQDTKDERDFS